MQYGPGPYLLHGILIFLCVERPEAQRGFDVPVSVFLIPAQMVKHSEVIHVRLMIRQVRYEVLERAGGYLHIGANLSKQSR